MGGGGWVNAESRKAFDEAVRKAFAAAHWTLREPSASCGCLTVRKGGSYLYIHPMEITGYVHGAKEANEVFDLMTGLDEEAVSYVAAPVLGEKVYNLEDLDVVGLFVKHRDKVLAVIEQRVKKLGGVFAMTLLFDELLREAVIAKNDESSGVLSSRCIEYAMLKSELDILIRSGRVKAVQRRGMDYIAAA